MMQRYAQHVVLIHGVIAVVMVFVGARFMNEFYWLAVVNGALSLFYTTRLGKEIRQSMMLMELEEEHEIDNW